MVTPPIATLTDFADPELGTKLGIERVDPSHFVLNPIFWKWEERVSRREKNRVFNYTGIDGYEDKDAELFKECAAHAEDNKKELLSEELIGIVHPYYLGARHFDRLKNEVMRAEYEKYIKRSINFLKRIPKDRFEIVLFENAFDYALITSLFVEQGLVDKVIFTHPNSGYFCNQDGVDNKVDELFGKKMTICGCYNEKCFTRVCKEIYVAEVIAGIRDKDIYAIPELILNSPKDCGIYLTPDIIHPFTTEVFPPSHLITIDQLFN